MKPVGYFSKSVFKSPTKKSDSPTSVNTSKQKCRLRPCAEPIGSFARQNFIGKTKALILQEHKSNDVGNPAELFFKKRLDEIDKLSSRRLYLTTEKYSGTVINGDKSQKINKESSCTIRNMSLQMSISKTGNVFDRLVEDAYDKLTQTRLGTFSQGKKLSQAFKSSSKEPKIEDKLIKSKKIKDGLISQRRTQNYIIELRKINNNSKISTERKGIEKTLLERFSTLEDTKQKQRMAKLQKSIKAQLDKMKNVPEINQKSKKLLQYSQRERLKIGINLEQGFKTARTEPIHSKIDLKHKEIPFQNEIKHFTKDSMSEKYYNSIKMKTKSKEKIRKDSKKPTQNK